ncbi:bacterio-opsin activator domain-containing protein [Haloplanus rubicundus]|uniref:PAS domain S-box protein n=1 Tax=Haloplanus rubicundus TaxID=1547898 RepID=A0A345E955_9EURY|nr:bacterio-opsin activator domain-containing protein [Haloplanus rubicundus]AXG08727.1 PAS domain S-box protein [Haloplanus rubicundus]
MDTSQSRDIYAETLAVFDRREDRYEPLTTPEVAAELDANRRTVYKRLRTLVDRGAVETKEVGSNARVWWRRPDDGSSGQASQDEVHERELERRSRMMESAIDGIAITDDDGEYVYVNESHVDVYGYDDDEAFLGEHWELCYPESELDRFEAEIIPALYEEGAWRGEVTGQRKDGTTFPQDLSLTVADDGGIICVVRDVTERRAQERRLHDARRFNEELVENAPFGTFRLDEELRITYENPRAEEIIGLPDGEESSDAIGADISKLPPIVETGQADLFASLQDGETIEFEFPFESIYGKEAYFTGRAVPVYRDDEFDGAILMATDISERRQYERELREANQFNEELVENAPFGMFRLDEDLRITYENPRAEEIIGLPHGEESSDAIGVDIRKLPPIVETGQADLFSRLQEGETIEFEFPFESIYGKEAYFTGRAVPVYRDDEFDGAILMATDISERRQYERELERQREQLAALDELNDVVRGITEAVVEQSTREEIEQVVCDRLADSDSYRGAWIATVDSGAGLEPRAEAGVDGYLDALPFADDGGVPEEGLIGDAVRTGEMQLVRNVREDGRTDRMSEDARAVGYRSAAVIPVVHQGMVYDVLGVCSKRPDAFAEKEREMLGQLGDVIGHAIAAVDRKRALMSDEVVELEIRIPELLDGEHTADDTVSIDRVTPMGGDEYLVYGTAMGDGMETVRALGEDRSGWTELRTFDERDGEVRFEQHIADPSVASIVADFGGSVKRGVIEDGNYEASIQFPPGTDVRGVVEGLREAYPPLQVVSQRQVGRERPSSRHVLSALAEDLTERQRVALEAGYFGGFFEWPRHRSGEEVAESIGVGASTFHQHVRKAEQKLLDVVFAEL